MASTAGSGTFRGLGATLPDHLTGWVAALAGYTASRRRRLVAALVALILTLLLWEIRPLVSSAQHRASAAKAWSNRLVGLVRPGTIRIDDDYRLSAEPLPVNHVHERIYFHNTPVSSHRPAPDQFMRASDSRTYRQGGPPPVITIVTATQNPRRVMLETAKTVFGQSLQNFEWVIIDDHSTDSESIAILAEIAKDPRVAIVPNEGASDIATCRNVGLRWVLSPERQRDGTVPQYMANLDDDDLYEFTALEKAVWMLESNPSWDLAGFYVIKFGASNETLMRGVHSGPANLFEDNMVPGAAVYSSRAVLKSGCRYDDVNFAGFGEDWDFWLCLAENGYWGGTVPEPLFWYRGNPAAFRKQRWGNLYGEGFTTLKARINDKHRELIQSNSFPDIPPRPSRQLDAVTWEAPFQNHLAHFEKSIMFVVPWLYIGGADIGALHQIQFYAEQGYRVTVVCTLHRPPAGLELRPRVLQFTHDVHVLPSFLNAADMPRYLKYLLTSRGIEEVVLSNSQLVYEMLPALVGQVPHVKFIDYLHNEAYDGWKSGGYPTYSLLSQRYLSRTITGSSYLRDWLIARGHANPASIGVVKLGIEVGDFSPTPEARKIERKEKLLGVSPETVVIGVVGRLDPQKRPDLVPDIADQLRKLGNYKPGDFVIIMLGDGDLKDKVKARIAELRVHEFVRVLGTIDAPQEYLSATDVFLLPSMSEGISIAVAEAMAMALPIVTAKAGALPEQLGFTDGDADLVAGLLIDHKLDAARDVPLYAAALHSLILDPAKRQVLGQQGRRNVEKTFNWRDTLRGIFDEVRKARLPDKARSEALPHPAAHYAIQNLLLEAHDETDYTAFWSRMKLPSRSGAGRTLQERCTERETTKELSLWIDKLEQPSKCAAAEIKAALHSEKLQRSAESQCGAWCVFDLTRPDYAGWSFDGTCWTPFDEQVPLNCKGHWIHRPVGIDFAV